MSDSTRALLETVKDYLQAARNAAQIKATLPDADAAAEKARASAYDDALRQVVAVLASQLPKGKP